MKIAIYGVSRAGKDYLIEKIVKVLNSTDDNKAIHIKGSATLNMLSENKYNTPFKMLTEEQKNILRIEFTEFIHTKENQYQFIFVDGHYAFPKEDKYTSVFTNEDRNLYDIFFYLDTSSERILKFSRNGQEDKRNFDITLEEIEEWKNYEKKEMFNVCNELDKELILLDEDTNTSIEFIELYLKDIDTGNYKAKTIAENFVKNILQNATVSEKILLLDCDNTLSEEDATYDFCKYLNIDKELLKQIFYGDRYTTYQFYKLGKLYATKSLEEIQDAAYKAKKNVIINKEILANIKLLSDTFSIIAVTSGVYHLWKLFNNDGIFNFLIACSDVHSLKNFITPLVKKEIVLQLKKMGKTVVAVGDSALDIEMLESADRAFIIAHKKLNHKISEHLYNCNQSKIHQLSYSKYKYHNIKTVEKIV